MTYYAVELYATAALAKAAIDLIDAAATGITVVPYREGGQSKFMVVTPAVNAPM
jgi:hypothetical protein